MKWLVIASVVAACRGPEPGFDHAVPLDEPAMHAARVEYVEPPPRPPYATELVTLPARAPITGVHGSAIRLLAVTDDGDAAVSADELGATRLWPALDGTREPVVIAARAAQQLAITHDGDGFVIAGLDTLGQLELVRVTGAGAEQARIAVDAPRPFTEVHALGASIVAVRDDQVIAMFDGYGRIAGELAAWPGERIASLAVRGEHALAVLDADGIVHGRWLAPGRRLVWGAATPVLQIQSAHPVALAPDGKRLAAVTDHGDVAIVELARGAQVATVQPAPIESLDAPIAFLDDGALAVDVDQRAYLYVDDHLEPVEESATPVAAAGGRLFIGMNMALVIAREYEPKRYLGYRAPVLADVVPVADGLMAVEGRNVVHLDARFQIDRTSKLPEMFAAKYPTTTLLDDHHALVAASDGVYVVELDSDRVPQRVAPNGFVGYSRASRVLALYEQHGFAFARYDPATATFGPSVHVTVERGHTIEQAFLLDPPRAGAVAAVIEDDDETRDHEVTEIRATASGLEIADTHFTDRKRTIWEIARSEHAIGWDSMTAPGPGGLVAESADGRLVLRDDKGAVRWTQPARTVTWTRDGRLVTYGGGLAYVDLATGALGERRCGWEFGILTERPAFAGGASLCEEP